MSDLPPGHNIPSWPNILNLNYNYNYHLGDGNSTNNNFIYNNVRTSEESTDTIAIIEKALGQHHLPAAVFMAQPASAGCMFGTRVEFLEEVHALLTSRTGPHIAWITGMAGTGKTSIALTLCQLLWYDATVYLGGSFFCSRSTGTVERTDVQRIVPTLATVLARQLPEYASALATQLAKQPDIAHWSVRSQIEHLLTLPLAELGRCEGQMAFVIDALDECSDQKKLVELIDTLADFKSTVPVKFLLTSRPEMHIRRTPISDPDLSSILQLHTIDPTQVSFDLRLYIGESLAKGSDSTTWYTLHDVEALVQRSGGLFIFASTVLKYILDRLNDDGRRERLRKVTTAVSCGTASTAALDQVYELVLAEASRLDKVDADELKDTKFVLACILTARASLSVQALADLTDFKPAKLRGALERLPSLVHVPADDTTPGIQTLHASFGDYMFDRAVIRFRITSAFGHDNLTRGCLRRLRQDDLCFNVSRSWSSFEQNPDTTPDWIAPSLLYACFHWAHHLNLASDTCTFDDEIDRTFQQKLLFWLEVLSIMKKLRVAPVLLRIASSVVKLQSALQFLIAAKSFVTSSYEAISRSAPHIYLSALPFTAKNCIIRQHFAPLCTGVISVETFDIDRHGGRDVMTITGHEKSVTSVAYSRNGKLLVSSSEDSTVRVWDAGTGDELMKPMSVDYHSVLAIAFASDDTCIAVIFSSETLKVKHILTEHERLYKLRGRTGEFTSAAFTSDGRLVASGSWVGRVHIWSTETGEQIFSFKFVGTASRLTFSADGRLLAGFMHHSGIIEVRDMLTDQISGTPWSSEGLGVSRVSLAISFDRRFLAAATIGSYSITIWDLTTPELVPTILQDSNAVVAFAFSPDGSHLMVGYRNFVCSWDCRTQQRVAFLLRNLSGLISSISCSPDGMNIAASCTNQTILIWDVESSRTSAQTLPKSSWITSEAVSQDNNFVISGSADGSVGVWNARTGEPMLQPLLGHEGAVDSVTISPNGQLIMSWSCNCGVLSWDAHTGEPVGVLRDGSSGTSRAVVFSPDGSQLASMSFRESPGQDLYGRAILRVWNINARKASEIDEFVYFTLEIAMAFSPDGSLLAAAAEYLPEGIHIWKTHSGTRLATSFETKERRIRFLSFSHDGTKIVIGNYMGTVCFLDVNSGQLLSTHNVDSSMGIVDWVACSPDERLIARISDNLGQTSQTMRIWNIAAPDVVVTVCVNKIRREAVRTSMRRVNRNILPISHGAATFGADSQSIILSGKDRIMVWQVEALFRLAAGPRCDPITQLLRAGLDNDGWVTRPSGELLLWVPPEYREYVQLPPYTLVIGKPRVVITADPTGLHYGENWTSCWRSATE